MTYLAGFLYVIVNEPFNERTLYKIKATDGTVDDDFDVGSFTHSDVGGVGNDGTDLYLFSKSGGNVWQVDTEGEFESESFLEGKCCGPGNPSNGAAFRNDASQLLTANESDVFQFISNGVFRQAAEFDLASAGVTIIRCLTFDSDSDDDTDATDGSADDILYMADADTGKISKTAVPGDKTNKPRGLAYDAAADELYILVDGKGEALDHILVVDPDAGTTVLRDFEAPSSQTQAITYLDDQLYVAFHQDGPPSVAVLDPSDGDEDDTVDLFNVGSPRGMGNDGETLLITELNFGLINVVDPESGDVDRHVFLFDPGGGNFSDLTFGAVAFRAANGEYFPIEGTTVRRFNADGALIEDFDIAGIGDIRGGVFVGSKLFMAEIGGNTIQSALLTLPTVAITKDPVGMAADGTDLFIAVNATPVDKIMKVDTAGGLDTSFGESSGGAADGGSVDAPGSEVTDLAFHGGALYAVTNDARTFTDEFGSFSVRIPMVSELDPDSGQEVSRFVVLRSNPEEDRPEPSDILFNCIGGAASDDVYLFLGVCDEQAPQSGFAGGELEGDWFGVDPDDTLGFDPALNADFVLADFQVEQFDGVFERTEGFRAFEITQGDEFRDGRRLLGSGDVGSGDADTISRIGRNDGVVRQQFDLTGTDITGMALLGIDLFLADDVTNSVLKTALPERTVEQTVVGSYSRVLQAAAFEGPTTFSIVESDTPVEFIIARNPEEVVDLTGPVDGFVVTDASITIDGRLNDPAIETVDVSIQLPFTALVNDLVKDDGSSDALWSVDSSQGNGAEWHIACSGDAFEPLFDSGPCSWRYAIDGGANFDTGTRNEGQLQATEPFGVQGDTVLAFETAYQMQPDPGNDQRVVEVAVVTEDLQGNDVIGEFEAIAQIVGEQFVENVPPNGAHDSFQFLGLNPFFTKTPLPPFRRFELPLRDFAGERVVVRFSFNSVNRFSNDLEGWYLDNIQVLGAGSTTVTVDTTRLTTPVKDNGVTYFREFTTEVALSEGNNELTALAVQPYSPFLAGQDSVNGSLDGTAPEVSLSGIPAQTSQIDHTLVLDVKDRTFEVVEVTQETDGGSPQTVFVSTDAESSRSQSNCRKARRRSVRPQRTKVRTRRRWSLSSRPTSRHRW